MSVCFYDARGAMVGVDVHIFLLAGPGPLAVTGIPTPAAHGVAVSRFGIWPGTYWKQTFKVTSDGNAMIKDGYDWYFVLHIPVAAPPAVAEAAKLATIVADSGSNAWMSVHSVSAQGDCLATCLYGMAGLNANCWEFGLSPPTGAVINANSVVTSPTLGDYVGSAVGLIAGNAVGAVVEALVPSSIAKHLLRRLPDLVKPLDLPGKVKQRVQQLVDGLR